ncbi:Sodium channel subunit beta-4 [Dissostichus eleginoides]|uniref:Sodium channel subunit beta-4 n=1 Tax=Dissostichus eleginoides TaxID=100907 RepID=A0AAD9FGA7_DISEL|nr:Sodium channel subunit beta-4 [Dissostichus eleginoides]
MASVDSTGSRVSGRLRSGDILHTGLVVALLLGVWSVGGLEVSTGKVSHLFALNGSTVLLPCTYASCIGIKNLYFNWHYNDNGSMIKGIEPRVSVFHERVEFVGTSKGNNISILLWNITFEDDGEYICFARNQKEKNRNHSASYMLYVVDQMVGGVIGLSILGMVIKALVINFLLKDDEKNKECLVSSGNDNTENGHSGAKADNKGTPKA